MPEASASPAHRGLILAACMAASFMAAVEATIMAIAMPTIAADLGGFGLYAWAFSAYMLAQAATIPIFGRLADIHGRRKIFFIGAALFLVGSTLCGCARTMLQLVLFRALQGLGAGGVQPIANTIVADIFTPVERARVQGMLSAVFGVAAVIGPSLGALIVQFGSWPLVFWINLPLGAVAIAMIALFLPERVEARPHQVSYLSSLLLLVAIGALMLMLTRTAGLRGLALAGVGAVFVAATAALIHRERRAAEPMLPLELWRHRVIAAGGLGSFVAGALVMAITAYIPTWLQGAMGRGADLSAVVLALMSVIWVAGSTTAGLNLPRSTYRTTATLGALAMLAGTAVLVAMAPGWSAAWPTAAVCLIGFGMGFCNTTYMVSVQSSVPWQQRGAATSSTMFLRFLGQSLGTAIFGAALTAGLQWRTPDAAGVLDRLMTARGPSAELTPLVDLLAGAMRGAFLVTAVLAALALALALAYPAKLGLPARPAR
jgi:EmrB/QacA subfamily drug resistance transporter